MSGSSHYEAFFRRSGYLKLPAFLCPQLTARSFDAVADHVARSVPPVRCAEAGEVARIDQLYQRSSTFAELMRYQPLLDILTSLLGPNIELCLNRHNHATVNRAGMQAPRLHRDVLQWSRSLISAIFYLEDATVETGCTHIIPTSQFLPFVGTPNNGGTWMDEHSVYADLIGQALPVPMPAGSVLLFDALAFHMIGENRSARARTSVAAAYRSVDELDLEPARRNCVLVCGERLYRGNDKE